MKNFAVSFIVTLVVKSTDADKAETKALDIIKMKTNTIFENISMLGNAEEVKVE